MSTVMLSDLPVEIIQTILADMDIGSILILAEVNRYFNHLALEAFFGTVNGGTQLEKFPPPLAYPTESLYRALRIAIGIEQITTIDLSIQGLLEGAYRQIQMLKSSIRRVQVIKTFILWVKIDHLPGHPKTSRVPLVGLDRIWSRSDKMGDLLISELHELMDMVVSKGCQKIIIGCPCSCHLPPSRLSSSQVRAVLRKSTLTSTSWRWAKSLASSSESFSSHPASRDIRRSELKDCSLRGPVFLGPTALTFTLDLLKCSANSVWRLEIHTGGLTQSNTKLKALVSGLLNDIHLPNLKHFVLLTRTLLIQGSYLTWFLSRHPELLGFNIMNAVYPTSQSAQPFDLGDIPLIYRRIHLPKLRYIGCPAHIAVWLLQQPLELSSTLLTLRLNAHGHWVHLRCLGMTICELRRRAISQLDFLLLGTEWWDYARNVSQQKDLELFGSDTLPKLKIVKLEFVLSPPPTLGVDIMVLAGAFIHLIKHAFSVEEVEINPDTPGKSILPNNRDLIWVISSAFPDLKSIKCNC